MNPKKLCPAYLYIREKSIIRPAMILTEVCTMIEGEGFSSEYYYDGYAPWNSDEIAYLMFLDFWAYTYPGVKSYSK